MMMNSKDSVAKTYSERERGATLVEAALVLPVLFLLLLGFIDVVYYVSAKALMFHGAQRALNLAQKIPFADTDIARLSDSDPNYSEFLNARQQIISKAMELPSILVASPSGVGLATIKPMQNVDELWSGNRRVDTSVIFLRPGERAFDSAAGALYEHPTLCSPSSTCSSKRQPTDSWPTLLRQHPMIVEFRCDYRPLLFFLLGRIDLQVTVSGYREAAGSATG